MQSWPEEPQQPSPQQGPQSQPSQEIPQEPQSLQENQSFQEPQQLPRPHGAPPQRHGMRRSKLVLIAASAIVLAAALVAAYVTVGGDGEEQKVRTAVVNFSHAIDRNDNATMLSLLCRQEAVAVADDIDSPDDHGQPQAKLIPITVQDVHITRDVATVRISRPRQRPATLFLRKEDGAWKLCDPERYRH